MHKFFVAKENLTTSEALIDGEDVKHIYKVLRLQVYDNLLINDCEGTEYLGEIKSISKENVIVNILKKLETVNESPVSIHLFQGMPKGDKIDLIVQKAVELGVMSITPVITKRVIVKNELGDFKKLTRLKRIALEACKQSKRGIIPEINEPLPFEKAMDLFKNMDLVLVPYEEEKGQGLKSVLRNSKEEIHSVAIVIGPEGGFEESEISRLMDIGSKIVTLGPRILRTETAGFVCISLVMYEIGDMGGAYNK